MKSPTRKFINLFMLVMLNLSVMASLRNLPLIAEYGWESAFFYLFVAIVFLFPAALVSAELATGWSQTGGIYIWVREAFGPKWGFFAVWMQWVHNAAWFPAILSFSGAALAYLINPELATSKLFLISTILIGFWGFTLFNYFGLKTSAWFSTIGVIAGTIIPGLVLIALGIYWIWGGERSHIPFSMNAFIPRINGIDDIVFVTGLFLAFGGLEVSAVHAREVHNPQKTFPRAIIIASLTALVLYVAGAISIAIMIPKDQLSVVAGLMEAFTMFFNHLNLSWAIYPMGVMIVLGAVGELNAWIIGPVRAFHATSLHGDLPPLFKKLNKYGMPANLLFLQAIIVSIASLVFLCMPSTSSAFWILSALSAQLYLVMYILMFLAAIKLRYSHSHVERSYKIPLEKPGIWIVSLLGAASSLFAFFIAFCPPKQLNTGSIIFYEGFLISAIAIMCLTPYIINKFKAPHWSSPPSEVKDENH